MLWRAAGVGVCRASPELWAAGEGGGLPGGVGSVFVVPLSSFGARWGRRRRADSKRDAEEAHPRAVVESADVPFPLGRDTEDEDSRACRGGGVKLEGSVRSVGRSRGCVIVVLRGFFRLCAVLDETAAPDMGVLTGVWAGCAFDWG